MRKIIIGILVVAVIGIGAVAFQARADDAAKLPVRYGSRSSVKSGCDIIGYKEPGASFAGDKRTD